MGSVVVRKRVLCSGCEVVWYVWIIVNDHCVLYRRQCSGWREPIPWIHLHGSVRPRAFLRMMEGRLLTCHRDGIVEIWINLRGGWSRVSCLEQKYGALYAGVWDRSAPYSGGQNWWTLAVATSRPWRVAGGEEHCQLAIWQYRALRHHINITKTWHWML